MLRRRVKKFRDVVSEIIALKNVVMSIAEQEELLEDICNDVLGYGPLEPLLARDDYRRYHGQRFRQHLHRSGRQGTGNRRSFPATINS